MISNPAFLFYSKDFICATLANTLDEKGEIITLVAYQHQMGHLSKEDMRNILGREVSDRVLRMMDTDKDGLYYFKRLDGKEENEKPKKKTVRRTREQTEEKKAYGQFNNVFLTDNEYKKLQEKYASSYEDRIAALSLYIESKGKRYSSHYATILSWDKRSKEEAQETSALSSFDTDDFFEAALARSEAWSPK